MTDTYKTDTGYAVDFPNGLDGKELSVPGRFHDCIAIPFVISGEPGLLDVRFRVHKQGDTKQDEYHEAFSSVLQAALESFKESRVFGVAICDLARRDGCLEGGREGIH